MGVAILQMTANVTTPYDDLALPKMVSERKHCGKGRGSSIQWLLLFNVHNAATINDKNRRIYYNIVNILIIKTLFLDQKATLVN